VTYPRTDSRALPEDYTDVVVKTMQMLAGKERQGSRKNRVEAPAQRLRRTRGAC